MPDPFLRIAQRELSKLEAKLASNPDFCRWQAVKATIETYQKSATAAPEETAVSPKAAAVSSPQTQPSAPATPRAVSRAPHIIAEAVKYLREKGCRVNSTVMARDLMAHGVELTGKNPAATLSAYLSAAAEIDNVRGEGYGLKEWGGNEAATAQTEAPDSSKLSGAPMINDHLAVAG